MANLTFLKSFFKSPGKIGAVFPSSQKLANLITDCADLANANVVLEFGSGTGVFTEKISQKKKENSIFLAFEPNSDLAEVTRKRCPDIIVIEDSAANAQKLLKEKNIDFCDCVISGLPWASFSEKLQDEILDGVLEVLKPEGKFLTFAYAHALFIMPNAPKFKKKLERKFTHTEKTSIVWKNIPPAFVYLCTK